MLIALVNMHNNSFQYPKITFHDEGNFYCELPAICEKPFAELAISHSVIKPSMDIKQKTQPT